MATKKKSPVPKGKVKKDVKKLIGRNSADHILSGDIEAAKSFLMITDKEAFNPALRRLAALQVKKQMKAMEFTGPALTTPVSPAGPNWIPLGPLAVPNGQTYGGARVLISGRVTAIATHPTDGNIVYIGTSRGGIWKTTDGGVNWTPKSDDADSLAIGALAISASNPNVLYAGTGEGNVQFYSTFYSLNSAPGIYLGVGILKSIDGGNSWATFGSALFANHSFYRVVINPANDQIAFAASSKGMCLTTDGVNWSALTGGGLPAISGSVIACTDVFIDSQDATGNTVYAAFWGDGIYKSTNVLGASPTWTKLTTGLPAGASVSRISLAQSISMPAKMYALISNSGDTFDGVYQTTDATGTSWSKIISAGINLYGAFTNDIAVDPTTADVLYVSGVELYKCVFAAGAWSVTNIGSAIHPDSHAFAFHPTNNLIIYSGNDGGVYKSSNGGTSWDDTLNEGLCLLQYEAMDQHPTSDVFIVGGTQDNGTEIYRNSPVFYHAADGDGGYCNISPITPVNTIHSYYSASYQRSILGGKFGSWSSVSAGINGSGLFYPPAAISPVSERMAVGTDRINIDDTQGTGGWPGTGILLPGIVGRVSSVSFSSDTIIYAGTTSGQVYRLDFSGGAWTARALNAAPLPSAWIWDISAVPGNPNLVIAVFSGFGIQHVWQGTVPAMGLATWVSVSGSGANAVPDVPSYAIAFRTATEFYVGTDIGVFRTIDGGTTWSNFNQGMPNTAIYDLRYHAPSALLRAATHGRGLWEIKVDSVPTSSSDIFFRDNTMRSGRFNSAGYVKAAFEDPLQLVTLSEDLAWWRCADIKVDSPNPAYQLTGPASYLDFETKLAHRNPEKGNTNRVYVQVHNRGPLPALDVWVKIMVANAAGGLPVLPADFWTTWPNSAGDANWTPVGTAKKISVLNPLKPEVLEWSWKPPAGFLGHSCMIVVMDSASDPIPAVNKIFDIGLLVTNEKRAGLKNLNVVDLLADEPAIVRFYFHGKLKELFKFRIIKEPIPKDINIDLILPKEVMKNLGKSKNAQGFTVTKLSAEYAKRFIRHFKEREYRELAYIRNIEKEFDLTRSLRVNNKSKLVEVSGLTMPKNGLETIVVISTTKAFKEINRFSIVQENNQKQIVGGSTFIVRSLK